jgi:Anti-sigma factor NepR
VFCLQAIKTRHGLVKPDKTRTQSSKSGDETDKPRDMPVKSKEDMQQRLGLGLKNMYSSVLDEPLPDDIMALLDQLDDDDDAEDGGRSDQDE